MNDIEKAKWLVDFYQKVADGGEMHIVNMEQGKEIERLNAEIERLNARLRWRMCADEMPESGQQCLLEYTNDYGKVRTVRGHWTTQSTEENDSSEWNEYDEESDTYYTKEGWYELMDTEVGEDYGSWWMDCQTPVRWLPIMPLKEQGS